MTLQAKSCKGKLPCGTEIDMVTYETSTGTHYANADYIKQKDTMGTIKKISVGKRADDLIFLRAAIDSETDDVKKKKLEDMEADLEELARADSSEDEDTDDEDELKRMRLEQADPDKTVKKLLENKDATLKERSVASAARNLFKGISKGHVLEYKNPTSHNGDSFLAEHCTR